MLNARWMGRCKDDSSSKALREMLTRDGLVANQPHSWTTDVVGMGVAGRSGTVGPRRSAALSRAGADWPARAAQASDAGSSHRHGPGG